MPNKFDIDNPLRGQTKGTKLKVEVTTTQAVGQEQESALEQQTTETQEVAVKQEVTQQQGLELYNGTLIDYAAFSQKPYKEKTKALMDPKDSNRDAIVDQLYEHLEYECFANLPNAVKYLSEEAANEFASRLPSLLSFNNNHLPSGFFLRETNAGELVLHFDKFEQDDDYELDNFEEKEADKEDVKGFETFEPQVRRWFSIETLNSYSEDETEIYDTESNIFQPFFNDDNPPCTAHHRLAYDGAYIYSYQFGGSTDFYKDNSKRNRFDFIYKNYLSKLPTWEDFIEGEEDEKDSKIFGTRLFDYNKQQWQCLKLFLENTGSSGHNINRTLDDFDHFWEELEKLCDENEVSIDEFTANFSAPESGHPSVYIERLLDILKNSRNLKEQFAALEGLKLDKHGAYYASTVEGFRVVSKAMKCDYHPATENKRAFAKNRAVYKAHLTALKDRGLCNRRQIGEGQEDEHLIYRCIGTSEKSIDLPSLEKIYSAVLKKLEAPPGSDDFIIQIQNSQKAKEFDALLISFFAVCHEEVSSEQHDELNKIIKSSTIICGNHELKKMLLEQLVWFYERDIKLSVEELKCITNIVAGLNSQEIETHVPQGERDEFKKELLSTLFKTLRENKHAALRFLRNQHVYDNNKNPIDYYVDTADFLKNDAPNVSGHYRNDLLLFAALMTNQTDNYCKRLYEDVIPLKLNEIKQYLEDSVNPEKANHEFYQFAIDRIITSGTPFSHDNFLKAFQKLEEFNAEKTYKDVLDVLTEHRLYQGLTKREAYAFDSTEIKQAMIELIVDLSDATSIKQEDEPLLEEKQEEGEPLLNEGSDDLSEQEEQSSAKEHQEAGDSLYLQMYPELIVKGIDELQELIKEQEDKLTRAQRLSYKPQILSLLKELKIHQIRELFYKNHQNKFMETLAQSIENLSILRNIESFEELNEKVGELDSISPYFDQLMQSDYFKVNSEQFLECFNRIKYESIHIEFFKNISQLTSELRTSEFLPVIEALLTHQDQKKENNKLCDLIIRLHSQGFSSSLLQGLVKNFKEEQHRDDLQIGLEKLFLNNPKDPVLSYLLTQQHDFSYEEVQNICCIISDDAMDNSYIVDFLKSVGTGSKFKEFLSDTETSQESKQKILYILTKGDSFKAAGVEKLSPDEYQMLMPMLQKLPGEDLDTLYSFFQKSPAPLRALASVLINGNDKSFDERLKGFERNPFGERSDLQLETSQVERVINNIIDPINKTTYSYMQRKQLMEAFLFVNACGNTLGVFGNDGKSAKDLTNNEIREAFKKIKDKENKTIEDGLLGLSLIRESMYRATGKFPYSTQMIVVIDDLMRPQLSLTKVNTGEGKALIDTMKASLLWLDSDHVTVTNPSINDARRDIEDYASCFDLLGIPYSKKPITSTSEVSDFVANGINHTSFSQFGLFLNKDRLAKNEILASDKKCSLIINESDDTLLNDYVVSRLAFPDKDSPSPRQYWIYDEINEFMNEFIKQKIDEPHTIQQDIDSLKAHLLEKADLQKPKKRQRKYIEGLSDERLWRWLQSAHSVYHMKENEDFWVPKDPQLVTIDGVECQSHAAQIIMPDGTFNEKAQYGDGGHQLLYARLNKEEEQARLQDENLIEKRKKRVFQISRETKTGISSTNRNVVMRYMAGNGVVSGSSATPGSNAELTNQQQRYGFSVSQIPPHKKSQMKVKKPSFHQDEALQLKALLKQTKNSSWPSLIICKDIETVKRFEQYFKDNNMQNKTIQTFVGESSTEASVIEQAGKENTITIATPALGRNKDIRYNRKEGGMNVFHTSVQTSRTELQGSGRTARDGSKGNVFFMFNNMDLNGNTQDDIRKEMEDSLLHRREKNEDLFDLFEYFLKHLEEQKSEMASNFIGDHWGALSKELEEMYHSYLMENKDEKEIYENLFSKFNFELESEGINILNTTFEKYLETAKERTKHHQYSSHQKDVLIEDCVAPEILALRTIDKRVMTDGRTEAHSAYGKILGKLSNNSSDHGDLLIQKISLGKDVNTVLTEVFFNHKQTADVVNLINDKRSMDLLKEYILKECKEDITGDISEDIVKGVKTSMTALVDHYLDHSWFINPSRKEQARELKERINDANSIHDLNSVLLQAQESLMDKDVERNQSMNPKKIHLFGHSRFQEMLSHGVRLTSALSPASGKKNDIQEQIAQKVASYKSKLADLKKENTGSLHIDDLDQYTDKNNAEVILTALHEVETEKSEKCKLNIDQTNGFKNGR